MDVEYPLVSVVLPCFNYGRFLPQALDSILSQNYSNIEVIVIDDGSTDDTRAIVEKYRNVKYFYQDKTGLAAARNAGIAKSSGEFLILLDADDWLLSEAIAINLSYLQQNKTLAFVSGANKNVFTETGMIQHFAKEVESDHYYHLLFGCYMGMPGAVMFRRWVFDEFLYDNALSPCADRDIYLRIAKKYPVQHHTKLVSAYRIHGANMSNDQKMMLRMSLKVLDKQKDFLHSKKAVRALKDSQRSVKGYYRGKMYEDLRNQINVSNKNKIFERVLTYPRLIFLRYLILQPSVLPGIKMFLKRNTPKFILRNLQKIGLYQHLSRYDGKIDFEDFKQK